MTQITNHNDSDIAKDTAAKNDKAFLAPFVEENLGQRSHHPLPYAVLLSPTAWVPVTPSAVAAAAAVADVPPNRCGGVRVWFDIVTKKQ